MKKFLQKNWVIILIFFVAFTFRLWGINAQGQTWDEVAYYDGGKEYITNLYHFDFASADWHKNFEHPPVGKWLYGFAGILSYKNILHINIDQFTYGRIASSLMGSLTIILVYYLVVEIFKSKKIAIIASLILTFLPVFIAHNKVLGLETPTALFYTLAVYLFYLGLTKDKKYFLWTGLATGLAIGTRFNNGHVLFFMIAATLCYYYIPWKDLKEKKKFSWWIFLIPIIAGVFIFAIWPWLWTDTINHILQNKSFLQMQLNCQKSGDCKDWFLGSAVVPPWYFFIYYFFATTPILLFLVFVFDFFKTIKKPTFGSIYIWLWFLIPFAMSFIGFKQDGMRYVFPVVVPLAIIGAQGLVAIGEKIKYEKIMYGAFIAYLFFSCLLVHPYYLDYYSETVGGVNKVYQDKSFEVGWWGEGLDEAYSYLKTQDLNNKRILVLAYPDFSKNKFSGKADITGYTQITNKDTTNYDFDYIVTNPAFYWYKPLSSLKEINWDNYEIVHEVKVSDSPIVTIYKKK